VPLRFQAVSRLRDDHVIPEDVQAVFAPVVEHRLQAHRDGRSGSGGALSNHILNAVDVFKS
jgi:hypothetical protein